MKTTSAAAIQASSKKPFFTLFLFRSYVLTGVILSACMGIDTFRSMVYQVFALLFSLLLISFIFSLPPKRGLSARRRLPEFATAKQSFRYTLIIENQTRQKKSGFELQEDFKDPRPSLEQFINTQEPFEHKRNLWDRSFKVQRWMWLVKQNQNAETKPVAIPETGPRETRTVTNKLVPLKRGYIYFQGVTFYHAEPLGLTRYFFHQNLEDRLLVLPKRYKIPNTALPGSRKHHQGGIALTTQIGNADEFISLRDYRPGDPMRRIHWKSLAKTGKLIIRENQDEHFVRYALILDTFSQDPSNMDFEVSVSIAASYAATIGTNESLLDLIIAGTQVFQYASGRGLAGTRKLLEILALVQPSVSPDFKTVSNTVMEHSSRLSGCIFVMNTLDEQRLNLMGSLKAAGIALAVFLSSHEKPAQSTDGIFWIDPKNVQACLDSIWDLP